MNGITVILPVWFYEEHEKPIFKNTYATWLNNMTMCEAHYIDLLTYGQTPQQARAVLPNSLKTEIVMTYNIREWRHFFKLRDSKLSHPQMQNLAEMMHKEFRELVPILFD